VGAVELLLRRALLLSKELLLSVRLRRQGLHTGALHTGEAQPAFRTDPLVTND
jgi:hypothetical protein